MTKFVLNIFNPDGSKYWTEYFDQKKDLNEWLDEEKTRPYWNQLFKIEVIDNTDAIKASDDARKVVEDSDTAKRKALRDQLIALRQKKNRTAADALAALDALIDYFGV